MTVWDFLFYSINGVLFTVLPVGLIIGWFYREMGWTKRNDDKP